MMNILKIRHFALSRDGVVPDNRVDAVAEMFVTKTRKKSRR